MRQRQISARRSTQAEFNPKNIQTTKKIAQGAFGTVYLAEDTVTKKQFAVKKFFIGSSNEKEKAKTIQEISVQKACAHLNVVRLFHADLQESLCSMYMEFCPYDLMQFIQGSFYPLDHGTIKVIAHQMLLGLQVIHSKGYIHRDLKPANVMITAEGIVKLGDFGCATHRKEVYSVEGFSKWYTAPEILFGSRSYGPEVDIWSFACVLAELLNGLPMFPGQGEIEQLLLIGQVLGSANESNWPGIVAMPDYGKINFKEFNPREFKQLFPLANDEEIGLIQDVLRYENRKTADELLTSNYFKGVAKQVTVGPWLCEKMQLNPYFNYMSLV